MSAQYDHWLRTDCWMKQLRQSCLQRAKYICQAQAMTVRGAQMRCTRTATEVHHLTYARVGRERPEDVIAVCSDHHRALHNRPAKPPRPANDNKVGAQLDLPFFVNTKATRSG